MTERIWKHLPYAVYMDTNAIRAAGTLLDASWIGELLAITNEYGISVCLSELALSEWCEHLRDVLQQNRAKVLSSSRLLAHFGGLLPAIKPSAVTIPDRLQLADIATRQLESIGINVIPNSELPLHQLLNEAVTKVAPFEHGGKGLCDVVILETYVAHAKEHLAGQTVLVVSNDRAVTRSAERFNRENIDVEFVTEGEIVTKLKGLLDDEIAALIDEERVALERYVQEYTEQILDFVRKTPLEVTDWLLNSPYGLKDEDRASGIIESIVGVRPTRIVGVYGGAPVFQQQLSEDRYPIGVSVELEIDVVVRDYGFKFPGLSRPRATVQPDTLDGSSPVPLETRPVMPPRVYNTTIRRNVTLLASIDTEKKEEGQLDDFRIETLNA